ncbi:MAG: hypothetical protein RI894_259 [Bacteroidota bacterium]|jgi:rRNA-processing protein FCF1
MTNLDSQIYHTVRPTLTASEQYLGRMEWAWTFCIAHYTAESTESVEFSLLDKVICGILQLDNTLNWVKIGEILGLNVVQDVRNHRYIDFAEREILQDALSELAAYGMIETGGAKFEACRLTPLGREYAAAGKKFKVTHNKSFKLYFDPVSGDNIGAKERFEYLRSKASAKIIAPAAFANETVVRAIAAVQAPYIHNLAPDQLRTFRKAVVQRVELSDIKLQVAVVENEQTKDLRLVLYDRQNKEIHSFFTATANEQKALKQSILTQFLRAKNREDAAVLPLLNDDEAVDSEYFWTTFAQKYSPNCYEAYFLFKSLDDILLKQVKLLLETATAKQRIFVILPPTEDKMVRDSFYEIEQLTWGKPNLFVLNGHQLATNSVIFRESISHEGTVHEGTVHGNAILTKNMQDIYFLEKKKQVSISYFKTNYALVRNVVSCEVRQAFLDYTPTERKPFIDALWRKLVSDTLALLHEPLPERVNKAVLQRYADCDLRMQYLDDGTCMWFGIAENKATRLLKLADLHHLQLKKEADSIAQNLPTDDDLSDPALRRLTRLRLQTQDCINDCLADTLYDTIREDLAALRVKIEQKEAYLRDRILSKTYIIDTNVFIDQPDILSLIDFKHQVIVSSRVLDELDKLKTDDSLKMVASRAISNIRREQKRREKEKKNPIVFRNGNINLLPTDFNQRTNDNFILSVALTAQYKEENVVLLTSDNGLRLKAEAVGVYHNSLADFLEQQPARPKLLNKTHFR